MLFGGGFRILDFRVMGFGFKLGIEKRMAK